MEVKEAIKSLGFIVEAGFGKMYKNEAESIIELLERGEVSRQIIEKMRNDKYDVWVSLPGGFTNLPDFILDIEREVTGK